MNLNETHMSPIPSSWFRKEAPLYKGASGDWHQEFSRRQYAPGDMHLSEAQVQARMNWQGPIQPQYGGYMEMEQQSSHVALGKQPEQQHPQGDFDEAAFERAFEAAHMEIMDVEKEADDQALGDVSDLDQIHRDPHSEPEETAPMTFDYQVGHDPGNIIDYSEPLDGYKETTHNDSEADELARTAGQLLDNLKHERSEKFQNSKFMELMRQLRDKEIRVEGDKMVDVSNSSPLPHHPQTPNLAQLYEQELHDLEAEHEHQHEHEQEHQNEHNHVVAPDFITCKVMQCKPQE